MIQFDKATLAKIEELTAYETIIDTSGPESLPEAKWAKIRQLRDDLSQEFEPLIDMLSKAGMLTLEVENPHKLARLLRRASPKGVERVWLSVSYMYINGNGFYLHAEAESIGGYVPKSK